LTAAAARSRLFGKPERGNDEPGGRCIDDGAAEDVTLGQSLP
jgi:hypothetical protein